jgi:DNA-binding GntR family transcriptional regulator
MTSSDDVFESVARIGGSSTAEQVADGLRQLILEGQLAPNTQLKEVTLASAFGTSRNTIREALLLLTHEGIVQRNRHRGAVVTALDPAAIRDMARARRVVEIAAVDAFEETQTGSLDSLAAALEDLVRAVESGDWHRIPTADAMFHKALVSLSGSPHLMALYDQLLSEIRLATLVSGTRDHSVGQSVVDEHQLVYDLLKQDRFDECRDEIRRMLRETEERLLEGFRPGTPSAE